MPAPTPVLLGYANRVSVAAGESIEFKISSEAPAFRAQLVRLIHGDVNPAGPGYREEQVSSPVERTYPGRRQTIAAGSYVRVEGGRHLNLSGGLTIQAWVWPTTPGKAGGQGLLACWSTSEQSGFAFGITAEGRLQLDLGRGATPESIVHAGATLERWRWTFVAASFDPQSQVVSLYQASAEPLRSPELAVHHADVQLGGSLTLPAEDLLLAARGLDRPAEDGRRQVLGAYNGKLDRPRLFDRALEAHEVASLQRGAEPLPAGLLAAWDFSPRSGQVSLPDGVEHRLDGRAKNLPTGAVTDHTWSGREQRWTSDPSAYAAIHFHDDDLDDAGWQTDFELTIPDALRSGVYAVRLTPDSARVPEDADPIEEYIPFYVRPRPGRPTAKIAFLAPTFTYLAYANERLYWNPGFSEKRGRITPLEAEPPDIDQYMAEHRELGLSLYDVHSDGSGCSYSSRLRPILNMRPKYRAWRLHAAPRHFAADLYLVAWLEAHGFAYDVVTDEDLHHEGADLLAGYRVILTGSHPEYHTEPMLTGMRHYLEHGGRLMYLGGNGFYWVTSMVDSERPHAIELRRGTSGTRAWESLPGESYHSTTGEPGGLWRQRGWAPQRLVGVGFAAQGWGGAAGYRRLEASHDPRVAFIFKGLTDSEMIGDFGLVLGGAAGDEIDRFDLQLGSPSHALLLATSAGQHTDYYQVTVEDVPIMVPGQGGRESPKVRADMVFFETPNGGAVFSVGSINWLGSLGWNAYHNNVSRVTENVLRHFLD